MPTPFPAAPAPLAIDRPGVPIGRRSPLFRRLRIALFLAGFVSFGQLYCVQPLLAVFGRAFSVSPAGASLALSLGTGFLALGIVGTTPLAARFGRKAVMTASVILSALCTVAVGLAPDWGTLLGLRAVEGLLLGGVPAVAMAHLADEIAPEELPAVMGLYISGTGFGGLGGRIAIAAVSDWGGWRAGMVCTGLVCLAAAAAFVLLLPPARMTQAAAAGAARPAGAGPRLAAGWAAWGRHLRDPGMLALFATGFLAMSVFVSSYNYLGFRLLRPPFSLGQAASGAVFLVYPFGIVASPVAGRLSARFGAEALLAAGPCIGLAGLALALLPSLVAVLAGMALVTIGFFVSHSVASAAVGRRASRDRGHASALYLLFYYVGSSVMGTVGGWFWSHGGWPGVSGYCAALLAGALLALLGLWRADGPDRPGLSARRGG